MLIVLFFLLLSAWNTGENLLYIVFGGVAGMLFLSIPAARWALRRVTLKRQAPHAVFRGDPFSYTATIENHKRFMPALSLRMTQAGEPKGYVMHVPAGHGATISAEYSFAKRGVYALVPCELATSFPFGFLTHRRLYVDAVEVLVYPRIRPARLSALEHLSGAQFLPARIAGEGDEYFSLREYVHGDDLRLVVWRVSARLGVWMVREMGVGNARVITFVLDTRRNEREDFSERFEEIIETAASLMVTLLSRQYSVGLLTPDVTIPLGKGGAQERRLLDCLARIMPVESAEFPDFEARAQRLMNEATRVVYASPNPLHWHGEGGLDGLPALDPGAVVYA